LRDDLWDMHERDKERQVKKRKDVFWLILLRLIIITALVVSAVIIQYSTSTFLPVLFYYLIIFAYFLSLIYILVYYWGKHQTFHVYLQIFFDLLLITAFVYFSGGLRGSFYFLYIFEIIAASIVLSKRAAYLTAALSGVFFGVLVNGMHLGFIPYFGSDQPAELSPGSVVNNIVISWSVFFLVAFLMNYMTEGLRRTAEKLRLAERELEIKKRLAIAGEFSAHLAHEIRNPLTVISGSVQVLRTETALDKEHKDLMDNIVQQSERVSHSIGQFLNLVSPGKHTFSDIDLCSVVDETLVLLEGSGELNEKFRVEGNFRSSRVSYFGNSNQFKQMFWNLIRNSIKTMPDGGIITVDFEQHQKNGIQLKISDTGNGMGVEERRCLLESFQGGFDSGRAIGMVVVHRIIDDYNGKVKVLFEYDKGTEVIITLPQQQIKSNSRVIL
jgi:signal transduction histidine kinase